MNDRALRRLAEANGVQLAYNASRGPVVATPEGLRAVLAAIGVNADEPVGRRGAERWPPVLVVSSARPRSFVRRGARVQLESGEEVALPSMLPGDLPFGYHRIVGADGESVLTVAPDACYLPEHLGGGERDWGYSIQLYAMRSARSWGIGDLGDLRLFGERAARPDFVLLNPLHAARPTTHQENSPYSPSSRRYRNPLYIAVEEVPEFGSLTGDDRTAADDAALAGRALTANARIDRDASFKLKDEILRRAFRAVGAIPGRAEALAAFRAADPVLDRFATFCVIAARHQGGWQEWPESLRRGDGAALDAFATENQDEVGYHAWLQMVVDEQLAQAGSGRLGVITDLAVGVDGGGFDAWSLQGVLAEGLSVGAPPDFLDIRGQNWGLPPLVPSQIRERAYDEVAAVLRANMRHAGGLRIDHAMAFFRLFVIPAGGTPADGLYLRYPAEDLLGVLALESMRARCLVVGEALGTLEPGMLETLAARNVIAYNLVLSGPRRARNLPRRSMGAVTTHDMPTLAGLIGDTNLPYLRSIGVVPEGAYDTLVGGEAETRRAIRDRLRAERLPPLSKIDPVGDAIRGMYTFLARTPSMLTCVALDDALAAVERPNVPGTVDEHPNWRVPLPVPVEGMAAHPLFDDVRSIMERPVEPV